jgi:hypothetical protein
MARQLTWLPNVRGLKVVADTNGLYRDEPVRSFDCFCERAAASASSEDLITPGSFEFELSTRPSVLILSIEGLANAHRDQHVGVFLAGLMQNNSTVELGLPTTERAGAQTLQLGVV